MRRRLPLLTLAAAALAAVAAAPSPAMLTSPSFEPDEANHDCLQLTPDQASVGHVVGAERVELHVRLVLDLAESRALDATVDDPATATDERQDAIDAFGSALAEARLAKGVPVYDAAAIDLAYASFDVLETDDLRAGERAPQYDGQASIDAAKAQYGGERPAGTDLVYVLTDRDLTTGTTGSALAGLADCIGGVGYPDRAFATGEIQDDEGFGLTAQGLALNADFTAKVAAHEIGHLMGAHHHYQECGHHAVTNYADGNGAGACSLMTNAVDFTTFGFSQVNRAVVRGHAEAYANG